MRSLCFIILALCLFFIFLTGSLYLNKETYKRDNIVFFSKEETYRLLSTNKSFYDRFTDLDIKVRGVNSIEEYIENIKSDVCEFTEYEKDKLRECCKIADDNIRTKKYRWFDGEKASNIEWKFCCVNNYYEISHPHTIHGNIIVVSKSLLRNSKKELTRTLIHEKVHVYQSKYKEDLDIFLRENGFEIYKEREPRDNIRVNPDTDKYIYRNKKNNIYYKAVFIDNPKKLSDVRYPNNNFKYEHPFEEMAISISEE